jgi:hypothetical protein
MKRKNKKQKKKIYRRDEGTGTNNGRKKENMKRWNRV